MLPDPECVWLTWDSLGLTSEMKECCLGGYDLNVIVLPATCYSGTTTEMRLWLLASTVAAELTMHSGAFTMRDRSCQTWLQVTSRRHLMFIRVCTHSIASAL